MNPGAPSAMPRYARSRASASGAGCSNRPSPEALVTAALCQYESLAIALGWTTLSAWLWKLPRKYRWLIWLPVAALGTYHFIYDAPHERRLHVS